MAHFAVTHLTLPEYPGLVLYIGVHDWNPEKPESGVNLNLEWMSLGLDLYGDTLQESYIYRFPDLNALIKYLGEKYAIPSQDIQPGYRFESSKFPDPFQNPNRKIEFQLAWERFREDFRKGKFLDPEAELIYSSIEP